MNKRILAASAAALALVTAVSPTVAQAAVNLDLQKKVVGMAGIMNVVNTQAMVSRAEFAGMAVYASSYGSGASAQANASVFADVPRNSEYASYIKIAVEKGLMNGYLGGVFKPDQGVTLNEAVKAVLALLGYADSDFTGDQAGGRIAKYHFLKLNDSIGRAPEELLSKEDCIRLFYNLLKTTPKGGGEIYGKLFGCELTADGEINPLTLADNGLKGPKLIRSVRRLSGCIPFSLDKANVFINGEASRVSTLKEAIESSEAVLVYYHAGTKTIWAYTEDESESGRGIAHGTLANIYYTSTNVMTPSSITLEESGEKYELKSSEMQFAFSMYGDVRIGDTVTLVYEKTTQSDGSETYTVVDYIED